MKKALFPGTFDPFTIGHRSIVNRALFLFDEIIIALGTNTEKKNYFPIEKRIEFIEYVYLNEPKIKVTTYDTLTIDFAKKIDIPFILRGIRTNADFEYEKNIADINRKLSGIETFLLFTEPEYAHISSSLVRELIHYQKDVSDFIPFEINLLKTNYNEK